MSPLNLILLALSITTKPTTAAQECYLMNGQSAATSHSPCIADLASDVHSPCCALATDICLESGLCLASNGLMYETGCTDPTWEDDACPKVCPDASTNWRGKGSGNWTAGEEREYWQVQACSGNEVCCRSNSGDGSCCESGDRQLRIEFQPGMPVFDSEESVSTRTTTATRVVTVTVDGEGSSTGEGTPLPTCVPADNDEASATGEAQEDGAAVNSNSSVDCRKRETTVGAAVGASLGAALVATLGAIWFLLQRQKKLVGRLENYQASPGPGPYTVDAFGPVTRNQVRPVELDGERKQYELGSESSATP
ncbi:hypothetical protein BJX70DRAFT_399125 [Aspergillus crustosus]